MAPAGLSDSFADSLLCFLHAGMPATLKRLLPISHGACPGMAWDLALLLLPASIPTWNSDPYVPAHTPSTSSLSSFSSKGRRRRQHLPVSDKRQGKRTKSPLHTPSLSLSACPCKKQQQAAIPPWLLMPFVQQPACLQQRPSLTLSGTAGNEWTTLSLPYLPGRRDMLILAGGRRGHCA